MKNLIIKLRTYIKFLVLVIVLTIVVFGAFIIVYKPIYKVTLNGELLGYCKQKSNLQSKIDEFVEKGDQTNKNIAFVQIDEMPNYSMCLLKRGIETNDDEILNKIKQSGTTYYKYYAILENDEEKIYIDDFSTAEKIIETLKEKESENIDNIQIIEKYETDLKEFATEETAVASLYKEKVVEEVKPTVTKVAKTTKSSSFSTSRNMSKSQVSLGISLIKPVTGTITSRFGASSRLRSGAHTGLDISASKGTPIKAAASGTVSFAGTKGSYGKLVVITHSNGVQTYYGHCSSLYVSEGQKVSQGEKIAAVGSTGNSTGPHLHLEIRINGVAYNPQNYLY